MTASLWNLCTITALAALTLVAACGEDAAPAPAASAGAAGSGALAGSAGTGGAAGEAGTGGAGAGGGQGGAGGEGGSGGVVEAKPVWLRIFGGTGDDGAVATAVHTDGSVVVAGYFQEKMQVGDTTLTSLGGLDAWIARLDADGNPLWVRSFGSPKDDALLGVGVDAQGEIFVSGAFRGPIDLGSGIWEPVGEQTAVLMRLSAGGDLVWTRRLGESSARALVVSPEGQSFVAGMLYSPFDFGGGTLSPNNRDGVIVSYDREGGHVWSKIWGGPDWDGFASIARGKDGDLWATGSITGQVDLSVGEPHKYAGQADVWLIHTSAQGELLGVRWYGTEGVDETTGVAVGPDNEVVVALVTSASEIDLGTGPLKSKGLYDAGIVKLDGQGKTAWTKLLGGSLYDAAFNAAIDGNGDVYISGGYGKGFDLGSGPLQPSSFASNIVYKLNPQGEARWWLDLGGGDLNSDVLYGGLAVAPTGGIVSVGRFSKALGGVASQGKGDVFVARLAP